MENRPLEKEHNIEPIHNNDHREGLSASPQENSPILSGTSELPSDAPKKASENPVISSGRDLPSSKEKDVSDTPGGKPPKKAKGSKSKRESEPSAADSSPVPVRHWFVTLMCMNIPVIGWIYLIILACSRSKGPRRDFAKAYLLYKLVFLLLSLAILAVAVHYGLEFLDKVLAYMEML